MKQSKHKKQTNKKKQKQTNKLKNPPKTNRQKPYINIMKCNDLQILTENEITNN